MLAALRRHLLMTTWVIVGTQSLVVALGTAQVCVDRQHTHAGLAAPDCAMHHEHGGRSASGHAHYGHNAASPQSTDVQISCRCSTDVPATLLGESGIVESPVVASVSLHVVLLARPPAESFPAHVNPPSSPPPRL